ncbi:hypothetical protein ACFPYJ_18095 [Paenibacillus solisilvae]|uniref:Uncharacterized protein n=1 Tax=Paenibacillus solisilvae TaxID=2486751 RepID=A0ABW0W3J6_9BACL
MTDSIRITADDLAKIAITLTILGDGLGLLAIEKAVAEEKAGKAAKDNKDAEVMKLALNNLINRRLK